MLLILMNLSIVSLSQCRLIVIGCPKKFIFKHGSGKVIKEWVQHLKEEIKPPTRPMKNPIFWKVTRILIIVRSNYAEQL